MDENRAKRIEDGRKRHGVGVSTYLPGNVQHLVSPIVGTLRLRERDGKPVDAATLEHFIDRLSLVLDLAREEEESDFRTKRNDIVTEMLEWATGKRSHINEFIRLENSPEHRQQTLVNAALADAAEVQRLQAALMGLKESSQ